MCDQLAKDAFLESVEPHNADFHQRWSKRVNDAICYGETPVAFHELTDDFLLGNLHQPGQPGQPDPAVVRFKDKPEPAHSPTPSTPSTETEKLTSKWCPGCLGVHRIRGKGWWQNCWVYHDYMGSKTAPRWFNTRTDKLENVRNRLLAHPEEEDLAQQWYLSK